MFNIGILADTHLPDRVRQLNPKVLSIFQDARVKAILHAGDVTTPRVLRQLEKIAPTHAVRGNRDWIRLFSLPVKKIVELAGITIGMNHGYSDMRGYLKDKFLHLLQGYQFDRYQRRLRLIFPQAQVIVFGHTHIPESRRVNGKLFINPGSASIHEKGRPPSVALLRIEDGGHVQAEILSVAEY